jgi:hypothetical protein
MQPERLRCAVPLHRSEQRMSADEITTDIPARMDRLPWSRFHLLVVVALGINLVRGHEAHALNP